MGINRLVKYELNKLNLDSETDCYKIIDRTIENKIQFKNSCKPQSSFKMEDGVLYLENY